MTPAQKDLYDGALKMLDAGRWHEGGWNLRVLAEAMQQQLGPEREPDDEWKADYALIGEAHTRACKLQVRAMRIAAGLEPSRASTAAKEAWLLAIPLMGCVLFISLLVLSA